ncbi:MAG TPA: hypothetical protein VH639_28980 [Bryobacteraceae bacterium]
MIYRNAVSLLAGALVFTLWHGADAAQTRPGPGSPKMPDKEALAKRIEPHAKETADLVRDANTSVEQYPTPFFSSGAIYRVTNRAPRHPIWFTVGCAGQDYTVMLPMNQKGFMELATKAGLDLRGEPNRLAYVIAFLEATQDTRKRFQILNGASDIQIINQATDEEKARYDALVEKYRSIIKPPKFDDLDPSRATVFALVGQDLVEIGIKLSNSGKLERSDKMLEENLPIAYAK